MKPTQHKKSDDKTKSDGKFEFNQKRSHMYSKAMNLYPFARFNELEGIMNIFERIKNSYSHNHNEDNFSQSQSLIDFGAGEGYLLKFISERLSNDKINIYAIDSSSEMLDRIPNKENITKLVIDDSCFFTKRDEGGGVRMGDDDDDDDDEMRNDNIFSEIYGKSIDVIVSLASFHHITKQKEILKEFERILKDGGFVIIGDVVNNTTTQRFFDDVVRKHCITGHDFPFLDLPQVQELIDDLKYDVFEYNCLNVPWKFESENDAVTFIKNLFGLNCTDQILKKKIFQHFKVHCSEEGFEIPWVLGYFVLKKKEQ